MAFLDRDGDWPKVNPWSGKEYPCVLIGPIRLVVCEARDSFSKHIKGRGLRARWVINNKQPAGRNRNMISDMSERKRSAIVLSLFFSFSYDNVDSI